MNMKNNCPLVSISCITYNHAPYIRQCLDGFMMQQTNFAFEVLIHDDASTDGTTEIIKEYEVKYPDIIMPLYEEENQWVKGRRGSAVFNFPRAKGKYIAMCEGDDYWTDPFKLQKQVDIMEKDMCCQIVFAKIQPISIDGMKQSWTIPIGNNINEGKVELKDFIKEEFYNCNWTFHTSSFVFRSKIIESYKQSGFVDIFPYGDMPMLIYNLLCGYGFYIGDIVGCYRLFSGGYNSMIRENQKYAIRQDEKLIKALKFLDDYTRGVYHVSIVKKISILQFGNDKKRYGKLVFFKPRYWNRAVNALFNKFRSFIQ